MDQLKRICTVNTIHIEDIPQFTLNLMKSRIPFSLTCNPGTSPPIHRYDYGTDKTPQLKMEEFLPSYVFKHLLTY